MALDTSGYTGFILGLLTTGFFWLIAIFALLFFAFTFLIIRKKRKLTIPVIEVLDIGGGKVTLKFGRKYKGGWFKHKTTFFGLWDYGQEEVFKLKDGRRVLDVSSGDYQDFMGRPGLYVRRSSHDPRILVPIQRIEVKNNGILETIAPAELRGASVDIIKTAEKETADRSDKIMQWIFWGGIIIFSFIAIIMITQMVKNGQQEAGALIKEAGNIAGKFDTEQLKLLCQGLKNTGETVVSTTAP